MKSSEQRIGEAIASLTARLNAWGVEDAATKAHQFVRDMLANGWRTTRAELDVPAPSWTPATDPTTAAAAIREQLRKVKA